MHAIRRFVTCGFVLAFVLLAAAGRASAAPGLLLIAHGSPSPQWNEPVLNLGRQVAEEVAKRGGFQAVRTAMLEAVKPDVPTAVAELEAAGCDRIIAVPLFIAPSGHTHFDVPAVLGIYSSRRTSAAMAKEKAAAARPKIPITLTATLAEADVLPKYALAELRRMSKSPAEEAVVFLAHGDAEHQLLVDRQLRRIAAYCCGESRITCADWAYIGVGQEYLAVGLPAIEAALDHRTRVLVVGLYVSTTAKKIHQRSVTGPRHGSPAADPLAGRDVVLSTGALVGHPLLLQWVLDSAYAAIASEKQPAQ